MPIENASYPAGLDPTNYGPESTGANSDPTNGASYIKNIREILLNTFANVSGAVTASHTELNYLDLTALGTAENSKAITVGASGGCNAAAVTWSNLGTVTTVDMNGGTIDGATIGGSSAGAGSFTTLTASGNVTFTAGTINGIPIGGTTAAAGSFTTLNASTSLALATGATVTGILDEDTMASDSATALATQQSIKAYVDSKQSEAVIQMEIADVSSVDELFVPIGVTGTVVRVDSVLETAINTADATVTLKTSANNLMASLAITASGSAAGDIDSTTTISNAAVTAGSYLKLATDGGSTGASRLWVSIVIDVDTV